MIWEKRVVTIVPSLGVVAFLGAYLFKFSPVAGS